MHPVALWLHASRDSHHQRRGPVGKDTEVQHLDVARAEVIHHLQVPDHKEEHRGLHQHPEEAGEEEVVKKARDEGADGLEGRSTCAQDPHPNPRPGEGAEEEGGGGTASISIPQTQSIQSFIPHHSMEMFFTAGLFGRVDNCRGLPGT